MRLVRRPTIIALQIKYEMIHNNNRPAGSLCTYNTHLHIYYSYTYTNSAVFYTSYKSTTSNQPDTHVHTLSLYLRIGCMLTDYNASVLGRIMKRTQATQPPPVACMLLLSVHPLTHNPAHTKQLYTPMIVELLSSSIIVHTDRTYSTLY